MEKCDATKGLADSLGTLSSVASFRSSPAAIFREKLSHCMSSIVTHAHEAASQKEEDDSSQVAREIHQQASWCLEINETVLLNSFRLVPWKEICENHDCHTERSLNSSEGLSGATQLQEFFRILRDPRIIPSVYPQIFVKICLEALLASPRRRSNSNVSSSTSGTTTSRWSPSQMLLLEFIIAAFKVSPALKRCWNENISSWLLLESSSRHTPHKWNRLLSMASHVATDCPDAQLTMMYFITEIFCRVDQMQIKQRGEGREKVSMKRHQRVMTALSSCQHCSQNVNQAEQSLQRRRVRRKIAKLTDLHDEDITVSSSTAVYRSRAQYPILQPRVSLKSVLSSKNAASRATTLCKCSCVNHGSFETSKATMVVPQSKVCVLTDDWALVRARGYKKFQYLFFQNYSVRDLPSYGFQTRFDWHHLLQTAHDYYHCPSFRFCLLLIGNGRPFLFRLICRAMWLRYIASGNSFSKSKICAHVATSSNQRKLHHDSIWLRMLTEFVVDSAFFDQRQECWDAVAPLFQLAISINDAPTKLNEALNKEKTGNGLITDAILDPRPPPRGLLAAIATVLYRRGRLLQEKEDSILSQLQSDVSFLALYFGEAKFWLEDGEPYNPDTEIRLRTLQNLGILGLIDLSCGELYLRDKTVVHPRDSSPECTVGRKIEKNDVALTSWPFCPPFDLRSAYTRVQHDRILQDGKNACTDKILAEISLFEDGGAANHSRNDQKASVARSRDNVATPMTDFIDDTDMLCQIFMFLDFQDIVKSCQVCKGWKNTIDGSNTLWYQAYCSRFTIADSETKANWANHTSQDWKVLLSNKWISEVNLRHQRNNATGWKYRTCNYIGCYHILKSETLAERHYRSHQRRKNDSVESKKKRRSGRKPNVESNPESTNRLSKS